MPLMPDSIMNGQQLPSRYSDRYRRLSQELARDAEIDSIPVHRVFAGINRLVSEQAGDETSVGLS